MRRAAIFMCLAAACVEEPAPSCPENTIAIGTICRTRCTGPLDCLPQELCSEGACIPQGGDDGGSTVDRDAEAIDFGVSSCTKDKDCGDPSTSEWSACMGFDRPCDETGSETRMQLRPHCNAGTCELMRMMERRDCTVSKIGMTCAPDMVGQFGDCEFTDDCQETAMRSRTVTKFLCANDGACASNVDVETEVCMRATEGDGCPPFMDRVPGQCMTTDPCGTDGFETGTLRNWSCKRGICEAHDNGTTTEACANPLPADGTPCGNGAQCCSGVCTPENDPANCGACGVVCHGDRPCAEVPGPAGMNHYACVCDAEQECRAYGARSGCVGNVIATGICACECPPGTTSPCTGECAGGSCYETMFYGYCAYP